MLSVVNIYEACKLLKLTANLLIHIWCISQTSKSRLKKRVLIQDTKSTNFALRMNAAVKLLPVNAWNAGSSAVQSWKKRNVSMIVLVCKVMMLMRINDIGLYFIEDVYYVQLWLTYLQLVYIYLENRDTARYNMIYENDNTSEYT